MTQLSMIFLYIYTRPVATSKAICSRFRHVRASFTWPAETHMELVRCESAFNSMDTIIMVMQIRPDSDIQYLVLDVHHGDVPSDSRSHSIHKPKACTKKKRNNSVKQPPLVEQDNVHQNK